ncbi:MAG: glutamate--tRNA ligase [Micrococcaceae bacterium]
MSNQKVRVRFCPSPTGLPHVGLLRTALFNWAYARHTQGTMIFRIEDTDQARDSQESYEMLLDAMKWLNIDWDEGVEVGGPHGPYRQSERGEKYQEVIKKLLDKGYLYKSYSTPAEVEDRHKAAGRNPKLGYDNFDRNLSDEQIKSFENEGREAVLRFKMPDEDITFNDLVRGEVTFKAGSVPDYAVVRANGQPLYTLVNPTDDALMDVTHVLRGEDLLSSTPRQIALHRAFVDVGISEQVPEFGHLPYVMGQGNKKLSKRDPESNLFNYRDRGFIPEGLLNYLSLLGWSLSPDEDIFTMDQMVKAFDIKDVVANPARFDVKKAEAINATHLRMLEPEDYRNRLIPYLQKGGVLGKNVSDEDLKKLDAAVPLVQERMNLLDEAPDMLGFLFANDEDIKIQDDAMKGMPENLAEVLDAGTKALENVDKWNTDNIQQALRSALIEDMGLKPRLAFGPFRTALSGRRISPPLFESMEILGKDSTLNRIQQFKEAKA